ncbi:MAG TPA: hypothetical protein VFW80_09600 [Gaiellaceae bacterium]|nr:hypothetical protein [Gaiellaceae bacterium]
MPKQRLGCHLLGCDWEFASEGETLVWSCRRCGREGGRRAYPTPGEARQYAATLNRGRAKPSTGLLTARSGTVLARRPRDRR